jgi:hypothetical protein
MADYKEFDDIFDSHCCLFGLEDRRTYWRHGPARRRPAPPRQKQAFFQDGACTIQLDGQGVYRVAESFVIAACIAAADGSGPFTVILLPGEFLRSRDPSAS